MCVKEFLGYNCGHCSIPYLRKCPLSQSNDQYPTCQYPAERPIFTNEYCHPCSRVLWNIKVLKEEKEHWGRHQRGECACEVIFDAEEKERRMKPTTRGTKAGKKVKERSREGGHGREYRGHGHGDGCEGGRDGGGRDGIGGAGGRGDGGTQGYRYVSEEAGRMGSNVMQSGMAEAGPSNPRESWEPEAQMAAYQYVGYHVGAGQGVIAPEQAGPVRSIGGYVHQETTTVWEGQLMPGQPGAGMKWYTEEVPLMSSLPPLPSILPPLPPIITNFSTRTPTAWQKAMSEPADRRSYHGSTTPEVEEIVETEENIRQPTVVSSDMSKAGPS